LTLAIRWPGLFVAIELVSTDVATAEGRGCKKVSVDFSDIRTPLIIPAPSDVSADAGIVWYEVQPISDTKNVRLVGFNGYGEEIGAMDAQMVGDHAIRIVLSHGDTDLTVEASIEPDRKGTIQIRGLIDGQQFKVSSRKPEAESVQPTGSLALDLRHLRLLRLWGRLIGPLVSAVSIRSMAVDSGWGCGGCILLGAFALVALPDEGFGPGVAFVENCGGACA